MRELTSRFWIVAKGLLFAALCVLSAGLLLARHPGMEEVFLVLVLIWASARFYYFAFYVLQHYVDEEYRFVSVWSCIVYLARRTGAGASGR